MGKEAALEKSPKGALGDPKQGDLAKDGDQAPVVRSDRQHRAGSASFVLSVVGAGAIVHTVLRVSGLKGAPAMPEGAMPEAAVYLTIVFGGALVIQLVALVLGFMGTFQKKHLRTLGAAGLALSFVMLAAILSVPLLK